MISDHTNSPNGEFCKYDKGRLPVPDGYTLFGKGPVFHDDYKPDPHIPDQIKFPGGTTWLNGTGRCCSYTYCIKQGTPLHDALFGYPGEKEVIHDF